MPIEVRHLKLDGWIDNLSWVSIFNLTTVTEESSLKVKQLLEKMKELEVQQSRIKRRSETIEEQKMAKFFSEIKSGYEKSSAFIRTIFSIKDESIDD